MRDPNESIRGQDLDPATWVSENLTGVKPRGKSFEADCPFCGKAGHLYVHAEQGYWKCFAAGCGESGRDITKLIATIDGISLTEARRRMFRKAVHFERRSEPTRILPRLEALRDHPGPVTVDMPPPPGLVPVWDGETWRMPRYLLERGVTRRLARRLGVGFCSSELCSTAPTGCEFPPGTPDCVERGRCRYWNRIILPFECPNGRSFTARSVESYLKPKYLNPPDLRSHLLYGWQNVTSRGDLVLVEGPFDVVRLISHGLAAVAIFGLSLSHAQKVLLAQAQLSSITVMLDAGVETEAEKIAVSLQQFVGKVYIARLPSNMDPGETTREIAWKTFRSAQGYSSSRRTRMGSIVKRQASLNKEFTT